MGFDRPVIDRSNWGLTFVFNKKLYPRVGKPKNYQVVNKTALVFHDARRRSSSKKSRMRRSWR